MTGSAKPDRIMWFSMWFLGAVTTFGLVFFPFLYYSIERRNHHFRRQTELEMRVSALTKKEWKPDLVKERNAKLWTASLFLILPIFAVLYFLTVDLVEHENRQKEFMSELLPEKKYEIQRISSRNLVLITGVTLGIGSVYWLYKIVNAYNNHFKEQRHLEHDLFGVIEVEDPVESL